MNRQINLIEELSRDLTPVRPVMAPEWRATLWLFFTLSLTYIYIVYSGDWREGAWLQLRESPRFLLENLLGLACGAYTAYVAFDSMLPGKKNIVFKFKICIALFLAFVASTSYGFYNAPIQTGWEGWRFGCEREILFVAFIPTVIFFILGMRSIPTEKRWTGFLIGMAASLPACVMMQLACMYAPWHTLLFHQLPVIIIGGVTGFVAVKRFKF